jgi:hypothetical protein
MTIVPASHGWQWIASGLALVGRAPLGWLVVSMSYWLVMGVISRLPYVGLLVASLATPALAIFAATALADGGTLARWTLSGRGPAAAEGGLAAAVALAIALWIPVQLAFWFAPVLAAWHGMPAPKALFFSFFAAARNWRALLVYGLAGAAALGLITVVIFNVQRAQAGPQIVPTLVFLLLVVFIPVYYATAYASYRDVFPESGDPPAAA